MEQSTRLFKIDNSVTVKAYFYEFKKHLEQLDLVRQNSRGVFDRSVNEVMAPNHVKGLLAAAKTLIMDPKAVSVKTDSGLTLTRV